MLLWFYVLMTNTLSKEEGWDWEKKLCETKEEEKTCLIYVKQRSTSVSFSKNHEKLWKFAWKLVI